MRELNYLIHKTVIKECLKKRISIRREQNGYYYIIGNENLSLDLYVSMYPTAKSGLNLIKRHKRNMTSKS